MCEVSAIGNLIGPQQVERLIGAATNPRDRAFIALLARSGIRVSEASRTFQR